MNDWKQYKRKSLSEMIQYLEYEGILNYVSVSEPDKKLSYEEFAKGYIARNPKDHNDLWYVAKKYFDENLEEDYTTTTKSPKEVINITDNIKYIRIEGGKAQGSLNSIDWFNIS